jgi:radical SAM protein with 4Fe4S-binding SPASM domain
MPCDEIGYVEYFSTLDIKLQMQRAPLFAVIELTERCNLRCEHCYIHDPAQDGEVQSRELTTEQWYGVFDELAEAGCLWMTWTGGEILLRSDFVALYSYAKVKGFLITLFTNGTLLTAELVDLLREWYPQCVEITLYGVTAETYEKVTGVRGAFCSSIEAIERLVAAGIPLRLKTVVMTLNKHELPAMYDYSASLGIDFRHDGVLRPTFRGKDIRGLRLPAAETVSLDFVRPTAAESFMTAYQMSADAARSNPLYDPGRLYNCGAGFRSFHIDPYGQLTGCHMVRTPTYGLTTGSFQEGWDGFLADQRSIRITKEFPCLHCELMGLCQRCPAFSELENADPETVVEYACAVAHLRAERLGIVEAPTPYQ